jgi:V8-like Glu-specific endopeptidase
MDQHSVYISQVKLGTLSIESTYKNTYKWAGLSHFKNLVLTAAHCLFDENNKMRPPTSLQFLPAKHGIAFLPYGSFAVQDYRFPSTYLDNPALKQDYDFALLKLQNPVPAELRPNYIMGTSGARWSTQSNQLGLKSIVSIAGYPGDTLHGMMYYTACNATFKMNRNAKGEILYRCDTFGGMSGSAIVQNNKGQVPRIIGVHTYGLYSNNKGTALTPSKIELINKMIQSLQ